MHTQYQQALTAMPIEDVKFILSQLPSQSSAAAIHNHSGFQNPDNTDTTDDIGGSDEENRRRRHIDREWPEIGTILSAEYYGEHYRAEIIPAGKKLKSGKQIRLNSGPALGLVCDSFSEAMLSATEVQRNKQGLGRKGTSNGWLFWDWAGKPSNINGEEQENDRE